MTYWKDEIHRIHGPENQIGHFGLVIAVTCEYQAGSNNMVGKHLPVVFSPFLEVEDHDLLEPKGILNENVPFSKSVYLSVGPVRPELLEIKHVVGV